MRGSLRDRFEANIVRIPLVGCWIWTGGLASGRYGSINVGGKQKLAHRVSYELHEGPIPEGLNVLHRCDVTTCVNPHHLFTGTQTDNMRDCANKGRHKAVFFPGTECHFAKINDEMARDIIRKYKTGQYTQQQIGDEYGITQSNVSYIVNNKTWYHLEDKNT